MIALTETVWAEFGLNGLVMFALFSLMGSMILFFVRLMDKKDQRNQDFISSVIDDSREDRKMDRDTQTKTYDKLAQSMDNLAEGLRTNLNPKNNEE